MPECPRRSELQQFLAGGLPEKEQDRLAAHLDVCHRCLGAIEVLSGEEPFLSEVAHQLRRPTSDLDPALARVMAEIGDVPTTIAAPSTSRRGPSQLPPGLLSESDDPKLLGMLGSYRVRRMIGRGGMGVVLEAEDPVLKRVVAIKVLAAHVIERSDATRQFVREARAAAAVTHENIVTVYAVDHTGKIPYLVMEYVEGMTLEERILGHRPMGLWEVLRIGIQIASGLAAAHGRNLIHRDIKPGNILLEEKTGRAKISDFGLARAVKKDSTTRPTLLAGTPEYMAPEQARGDAVDQRSDLFSFGSVLYAMCAGQTPFAAASTRSVITSVADAATGDLTEVAPATPGWLVDLIDRLHAEDPAERFQSATEVARVLRKELLKIRGLKRLSRSGGGESDPASPRLSGPRAHSRPPWRPAVNWLIKHWRGVGAATVSVLAVVLMIGLLTEMVRSPEAPSGSNSPGQGAGSPGTAEVKQASGEARQSDDPFVVLEVKDGLENVQGQFNSLADAMGAAAEGAVIEVRGDGPFQVEPVDLGKKSITLRAADTRRPVIRLKDDHQGTLDPPSFRTEGHLRIEGIEFRRAAASQPSQTPPRLPGAVLSVESARCEVINCRFVTSGFAVGIMADRVDRFQVLNCEFLCLRGAAVAWFYADGGQMEMVNCVQLGQVAMSVDPQGREPRDVLIAVRGSTFVAANVVQLSASDRAFRSRNSRGGVSWPITVSVSHSVLGASNAVLQIERPRRPPRPPAAKRPLPAFRLPDLVRWSGERNLFQTGEQMVILRTQGRQVPLPWAPRGLREWERFWGGHERNAQTSQLRPESMNLRGSSLEDLDAITAERFRLPARSLGRGAGESGRDIGARIEWVGPGAGYEAWKRSTAAGR